MSRCNLNFLLPGLLLALLLKFSTNALRNFDINFIKVDCQLFNTTLFSNINCFIGHLPNAPKRTTKNADFAFSQPIPNLRCKISAQAKRQVQEQPLKFLTTEISICQFLDAQVRGNIFAIFFNTMTKYYNEMPRCPFKTNFTYSLRDFYFNPEDFPTYMPDGSFRIELLFYIDNVLVGYDRTWMELIYTRKVSNRKIIKN